MGKIYLIRHGQACLGAANYDQLSPLGVKQSFRLGEYFKSCGIEFDAAYSGELARQQDTLKHLLDGVKAPKMRCHITSSLNEFNSHAVIRCAHQGPIPNPSSPEGYKDFFRLLRLGLLVWMSGQSCPEGGLPFATFQENIVQTLKAVQHNHSGSVLIVSSGGPISTLLAYLLGMNDHGRIELNLRLRNSSVSELNFNSSAVSVISFNTLCHLAQPEYSDWLTYA